MNTFLPFLLQNEHIIHLGMIQSCDPHLVPFPWYRWFPPFSANQNRRLLGCWSRSRCLSRSCMTRRTPYTHRQQCSRHRWLCHSGNCCHEYPQRPTRKITIYELIVSLLFIAQIPTMKMTKYNSLFSCLMLCFCVCS